MSDTGTTAEPVAAASEAASAPPAAEPSAPVGGVAEGSAPSSAGDAPPESMLDTDLPDGMQKFDRTYVEKLRSEAAENRVAARDARDQATQLQERYAAFADYDDQDLAVWSGLATDFRTDPASAATTMRTIATNVLGDPAATTAEKVEAVETIAEIDKAEATGDTQSVEQLVDARLAEAEAKQQQAKAVDEVVRTVTGAGFEKGSHEYATVLWRAANDPAAAGDVTKAIELHTQYRQQIIDEYVAGVAGGKTPITVSSSNAGEAAVSSDGPITSVAEGSKRARAFLREQRGG